jgi:hypothetical protein
MEEAKEKIHFKYMSPSDLLPLTRSCLLNFPAPPKTETLDGDQDFKSEPFGAI